MKTSLEIQVLQLFEQALAQPPGLREDWLAAQAATPEVAARALRLLRAEAAAGDFMEATAVAPEAMPPEFPKVGERLGNYELLKPLEAGGMGVVYLGRRADEVYDQQVAIKLIRPVHLLAAADFRRQLISRFEDERTILARMSHPNVARILDGGSTASGIPYLVMEYVDGISLTDYCKQNKLDVPARLRLFCKVCEGVQEAHRHLIVHRDLKPDNILVGVNGEPRLLDFGIAKILGQEPLGKDGKSNTSLSAMTPAYASPEQVRQEALTTSSDVYSLGVMLYQLLAGVRPYELGGLRPAEAEHVVCERLPEPMRKMLEKAAITDAERQLRRAQITPDVERIVAMAMNKSSARRYGSAQELADDIRRYLEGQPVLAHPDSAAYRLRKFLRRHRVGVAAASLALAAVLGSSVVAVWQAREARQAAADMAEANQFLLDVLRYSDPYSAGGEPTLSEAVDAALRQIDVRFGDRPEIASGIRHVLGYSLQSRGRLDESAMQLDKALAEALQAHGPHSRITLQIREAQAQLASARGDTEAAETLMRALLDDIRAAGLQDEPLHFIVLNNLGQLYTSLERPEDAKRLFEEAARQPEAVFAEISPDSRAILTANLAYIAHEEGRLDDARRLYDESEAMHRAAYPDGSAELAILLGNRAFLFDDLGMPDEGYAARKQALAMKQEILGEGHPDLVPLMLGIVQIAMARGETAEAVALAERAARISVEGLPSPHPQAVISELVLANTYLAAARPAEAGDALGRASATLATMDPAPEELAAGLARVRSKLCDPPAASRPRICGSPLPAGTAEP